MVTTSVRDASDTGASTANGIAYMCAGMLCLGMADALAKDLGTFYPVSEIVFFRMLFALPVIVTAGLLVAGRHALTARRPGVLFGRGLLATCSTFSFYLGLTLLPLAENVAIAFASPLFITLLAAPLLGERPDLRQWVATIAGFSGVLLVVQPGTEKFTIGAFVPMGAALFYALLMVSARMIGRRETIWATMLYATLVPLMVSTAVVPWYWETPTPEHVLHFVGVGMLGGTALTLITQAFRVGAASIVAPFNYTGLIWAALFGWMFWNEFPSDLAILGIVVILVCGVYLAYKHGANRRVISRTLPAPPRE